MSCDPLVLRLLDLDTVGWVSVASTVSVMLVVSDLWGGEKEGGLERRVVVSVLGLGGG